ncbi:uncharacterized protein LOC141639910 [Silene latifolia]|uniref:uncharacterized protein LOC141639910 n=1 Tax=Silene latifolia TaxID=37657 RepID=UPI003D7889B4
MKPEEVVTRSCKVNPTTDQAAKYACSAILKDSEFKEVDRVECQFTTTATVLDNGTLVCTVTCDGNHILKDPPFNRHSSNQLKAFGTNSGLVCQSSSWENLAASCMSIMLFCRISVPVVSLLQIPCVNDAFALTLS